MSFRFVIIAGVVLIQTILLAILIWNGLHALRTSSEEEFFKRTEVTVRLFSSANQAAILATDLGTLESAARELLLNPNVVYVRIFGGGQLLVKRGDADVLARPFARDRSLDTVRDEVFDDAAEINIAGQNYGRVEIGFSVESLSRVVDETRSRFMILAFADLMLILAFASLLGMAVTRKLQALREASALIAQGEFGYQVDMRGRDELAKTADAFNSMSLQLKRLDEERRKSEEEILALNKDLERRVNLRTHELADLNKELEYRALHDDLTRLPNRTLFTDRLQQAIHASARDKRIFALVAVDLDHFKEINDTLGHYAGDMVLREVSKRARKALRQSDTVARMGGDEFAILLSNIGGHENALQLVQQIHRAICGPFAVDGQVLDIGASMGIAVYGEHGDNEEDLNRNADAAMYEAKRDKTGVVIYHSGIEQGEDPATALKGELRHALAGDELILHYQPKFDLGSSKVTGVEALVRWVHPRHGLVLPDSFILLAEQNGMMKLLTLKVLQLALSQNHRWLADGMRLTVAVNISTFNLQDLNFPNEVRRLLEEHQVPAELLELEVTEAAIMQNPLNAAENITRLSEMGVQVSIDDFGTGYSSMAYLKKLLVAKIKIDKSFVIDMDKDSSDAVIVRSTIDLGHNLGLKVVAEGVEDRQAWNYLQALGCDAAQGYYMSKPLPPEQFKDWYESCVGQMPDDHAGTRPNGPESFPDHERKRSS